MRGILICFLIIIFWISHLHYCLVYAVADFMSPSLYFHILFQTYLYTGLFISAHDAMHGSISYSKRLNNIIGRLCTFLFAALSYKQLLAKHALHHKHAGREEDPDFYPGRQNLFKWWFKFLVTYATTIQLIFMAIAYNLGKLIVPEANLLVFWVLPAFLSSFQLFYFGTYLPHKYPHEQNMEPHKARSQRKNHIFAMISCYFFGYHYEHHEQPGIPWWKLYSVKK